MTHGDVEKIAREYVRKVRAIMDSGGAYSDADAIRDISDLLGEMYSKGLEAGAKAELKIRSIQ